MNSVSNDKNSNSNSLGKSLGIFLVSILSCCVTATARYFKNLPSVVLCFFKRKDNDYKRKPKRDSINRVYVLVGYTTKQYADRRYRAEHLMITLRRGLLLLILVLLLVISVNRIVTFVDVDQYSKMFGIDSVDKMTQNDPFANVEGNASEVAPDIVETSIPDDSSIEPLP